MGGVEDDEPPSKRVKANSVELCSLSNNSSFSESINPLGGLMARPLPSQGKDDIIGSKGVIKRVEFVRIITEALYSLGFERSGAALEEESGIYLHSDAVNLFREQVLEGNWDGSVTTLQKISLLEENVKKSASFLILEQKFFELLENGKLMDALNTLRNEIAPLRINKKRMHELSNCLISPSQSLILGFANLGIETSNSRIKLLEELQKLLPPTIMIPERRLEHLVEQALTVQRDACYFHNSLDGSLSLYADHQCGKDQIPYRTTQVRIRTKSVYLDYCWIRYEILKFGTTLNFIFKLSVLTIYSLEFDSIFNLIFGISIFKIQSLKFISVLVPKVSISIKQIPFILLLSFLFNDLCLQRDVILFMTNL